MYTNILKWLFKLVSISLVVIVLLTLALMLRLRWVDPSESNYMVSYTEITKRQVKFEWVDIENIHWSLPLAVIAAEDQKFPNHWGLDIDQIKRALKENKTRKNPRGASTITQQTVKNLYLSGKRSYSRKIIEAWL